MRAMGALRAAGVAAIWGTRRELCQAQGRSGCWVCRRVRGRGRRRGGCRSGMRWGGHRPCTRSALETRCGLHRERDAAIALHHIHADPGGGHRGGRSRHTSIGLAERSAEV
jgi:hypothetical protein